MPKQHSTVFLASQPKPSSSQRGWLELGLGWCECAYFTSQPQPPHRNRDRISNLVLQLEVHKATDVVDVFIFYS